MESQIPEHIISIQSSKWGSIAKRSVQKKNDRGDTIVIYLEGTSLERPLSDDDFINISPYLKLVRKTRSVLRSPLHPIFSFMKRTFKLTLPLFLHRIRAQAVQDVAGDGSVKGRLAYLDVKAQCNACGDAGARALCDMLVELREAGVAAVRAIHLWKNELGDAGACAVADLVATSAVDGAERFWVAEVAPPARPFRPTARFVCAVHARSMCGRAAARRPRRPAGTRTRPEGPWRWRWADGRAGVRPRSTLTRPTRDSRSGMT
jgi:hypothetical protein